MADRNSVIDSRTRRDFFMNKLLTHRAFCHKNFSVLFDFSLAIINSLQYTP